MLGNRLFRRRFDYGFARHKWRGPRVDAMAAFFHLLHTPLDCWWRSRILLGKKKKLQAIYLI